MTQHDDTVYFGHMLDMARETEQMAKGKSVSELEQDRVLQFALVHALQIIGDAARHVSKYARESMSDVQWTVINGMRHRIVHDYFGIDLQKVWNTIADDLPPLIRALELVVPPEPEE